jgi:hypothetical protein
MQIKKKKWKESASSKRFKKVLGYIFGEESLTEEEMFLDEKGFL